MIIIGYKGKKTVVEIPSKIEGKPVVCIGEWAFVNSNIKSITIPKSVKCIQNYAFECCICLTNVIISEGVTSIGFGAFLGCGLTSITIPSSVTYLSGYAFEGCSRLKEIVVAKENKVYDSRNNCNAIIEKSSQTLIIGCKNTIIPEGVKKIGDFAFSGCSGLTSITIPKGVTSIEYGAFYGCSSLKSIEIPESVTSIDSCAFDDVNDSFIIYSPANSYAHKYALDNGIAWRNANSKSLKDFLISLEKTAYEYDGKEKRPSVTVEMGAKKLVNGTDYEVKYANNVNLGTAKVTITGKGSYTGTVTKTFKIEFSKVSSLNQKAPYSTTSITMSWMKKTGVAGYEVYRADSKTGKYKKIKTTKSTSLKDGKLTRGKTYYYKVRAYKKVNGKIVYSSFSSVNAMGTKPQTPSITVVAGNKKAKVVWKKILGISGYEVYMSESKSGSYSKIKTSGSKNTAYLKTGLKSKGTYYFKLRSYRTVGGKKIYSSWSAVKSVKVK